MYTPNGVVNPAGTITSGRYPHRDGPAGYTSHSNTLVQDGGFFSIVTTTDSRGNVLSEQVIQHGPHPFGSDFTVLCDAIASAIG